MSGRWGAIALDAREYKRDKGGKFASSGGAGGGGKSGAKKASGKGSKSKKTAEPKAPIASENPQSKPAGRKSVAPEVKESAEAFQDWRSTQPKKKKVGAPARPRKPINRAQISRQSMAEALLKGRPPQPEQPDWKPPPKKPKKQVDPAEQTHTLIANMKNSKGEPTSKVLRNMHLTPQAAEELAKQWNSEKGSSEYETTRATSRNLPYVVLPHVRYDRKLKRGRWGGRASDRAGIRDMSRSVPEGPRRAAQGR